MPPAIDPSHPPMEARLVAALPCGECWRFEPKWDRFRCLAFRDGDNIELRSKSGQSLGRYFPDVAAALLALAERCFVLDGEIVSPVARRLSFEALQLRLHPAESRVRKLAGEHPALYIAFDLLADRRNGATRVLLDQPFIERRRALEEFFDNQPRVAAVRLSPSVCRREEALRWLDRHGTTLLRWRPDKAPRQCGMDQLPEPGAGALRLLDRA